MALKQRAIISRIMFLLAGPMTLFCGCDRDASRANSVVASSGNFSTDSIEGQATRIIQQALSSSSPQVRTSAIEIVAEIPINEARRFMPEVQRLLEDDFVPVRFAAAVAVGDTGYSPAKNEISQLLKDKDNNVRLAAAYAMSKLAGGDSAKQIRAAMTSSDQQVRANATFLLGKLGDKAALPLLHEAIKDETSDDKVRLNSIEAIAQVGDEGIYHKLWAMLISTYADDRVCGIRAMGALGTGSAKDSITTMLKDDLPEVRLVAAEQLGKLGDISGEYVVVEALTKDIDASPDREGKDRINTLAAMAIGQIKSPALKKYLPELIKNESPFVRLAAAEAVFRFAN